MMSERKTWSKMLMIHGIGLKLNYLVCSYLSQTSKNIFIHHMIEGKMHNKTRFKNGQCCFYLNQKLSFNTDDEMTKIQAPLISHLQSTNELDKTTQQRLNLTGHQHVLI